MNRLPILLAMTLATQNVAAQHARQYGAEREKLCLGKNIHYKVEAQASVSDGRTPLWLNANKHGLSSIDAVNGYWRCQVARPLSADSARRWGGGYGVDMALALNHAAGVVAQQVFVEGRWLRGTLTVGAKEYAMELKNNRLSAGSQTLGVNARPVPQVRLALPEYWTIPALGRWLHLKGHIAYGKMTDDGWQRRFTGGKSKYTADALFHSKAGYLKIGSEEDRSLPLSVEMGLEMATLFGGKSCRMDEKGHLVTIRNGTGLRSFLKAFVPGGEDVLEKGTVYENAEGDVVGSWVARVNYDADTWRLGVYADKFFEDHSSMFLLDYDGYGAGKEWNVRKRNHFFMYDLKDVMVGAELNLKLGGWLRDIVLEYICTKYQSGPIYHDHSKGLSDHLGGRDNFYNHYIFAGWQHWGQAMGNPLYTSPIYNDDGRIEFKNNRFVAWHLAFDGQPTERVSYRAMITCQTGWGTYDMPYADKRRDTSLMVEATYCFPRRWQMKAACGLDFGTLIGNNFGFQFTVAKSGVFNL
ncbi:capsule assembly Wzi family protein [Prevotella sp. S7-1-8]|uniref:capsule assembly Wzi family protein n=1 Tax=Prevotella sp. S7-1-8 TaxID=1284775 RepID=UPI00056AD074|nr:capsule assembly Wzi family protein [Prevotella sp. S7-1-8]